MLQFLIRRLLALVPLMLGLSLFTFILLQNIGDPLSFYTQGNVTAEDMERLTRQFGLDRPVHVRYYEWLRNMLQGDFGNSLATGRSVTSLLRIHFPNTLILMGTVFLVTLAIGVPLGIVAALHRNKFLDQLISALTVLSFSAPTFWTGIMSIVIFSLWTRQNDLPYLPSGGMYNLIEGKSFTGLLKHLVLPVSVLTLASLARYVRYMRSSMIDVLNEDYIRTARAKGLSERAVVYKHAFRNALLPIVTLMAVDLPQLMGGALITEQVFAWPGMGRLMVEHAARADFPVLMGILVFVAVLVSVLNIVADLLYFYLDPRIKKA